MSIPIINALRIATRPINGVTPFTYRDGKTYLEVLEVLREKINELIAGYDSQTGSITDFQENVNVYLESIQDVIDQANQFIDDRDEFFAGIVDGETATREAVQDVARDVVFDTTKNVLLAGLVGDGVTDNSAAFEAMIADLGDAETIGNLYFPAGSYLFTSPMNLTRRVVITGDGPFKSFLVHPQNTDFISLKGRNSRISDITVQGRGTSGDLVTVDTGYCSLSNVNLENSGRNAITIGKNGRGFSYTLSDIAIYDAHRTGIEIPTGQSSTDGLMSNVVVGLSGYNGVKIQVGAQKLTNVHVWGSGIRATDTKDCAGIYLHSGSNQLVNCETETGRGAGLLIHGSNSLQNTVQGLRSWGNQGAGIHILDARNGLINGCVLVNNNVANAPQDIAAQHASVLNAGGQKWVISNTNSYDNGAVVPVPSYTTIDNPPYPFVGRPVAGKTTAHHYSEVSGDSGAAFKNVVVGSMFLNTDVLSDPVVSVAIDNVFAANSMGVVTLPQDTGSGGTLYPRTSFGVLEYNGTATSLTNIAVTYPGHIVTIVFLTQPFINTTGNIKISTQYQPVAGSSLTVVCDGVNWHEVGRSA